MLRRLNFFQENYENSKIAYGFLLFIDSERSLNEKHLYVDVDSVSFNWALPVEY